MTASTLTQDRRDILVERARQVASSWEVHHDNHAKLFAELRVADMGQVAAVAVTVMSMLADELADAAGGDA